MSKSILIIGGMGHHASVHVHKQLLRECLKQNKPVPTICHIAVEVVPFHTAKPSLVLSEQSRKLLQNVDCSVGLIACNTAHMFFDDLQDMTPTPLFNVVSFTRDKLPSSSLIACSPNSKKQKLYGENATYLPASTDKDITNMIIEIDRGAPSSAFSKQLQDITSNKTFVSACSELSMICDEAKIPCINPMQNALQYVVKEVL